MKKNVAYIFTKAPYSSFASREAIEEALAFASFEQNLSVFYLDSGIKQLAKSQSPQKGIKNISALRSAFPLYDIEKQYLVSNDSIELNDSLVTQISTKEFSDELAKQDIILSF